MADKKKIIGLSVLVVGAVVLMVWLAGLLHFGKIAPGLVPLAGTPPPGRVLIVTETEIPRDLEVLGAVISKSLAQVSSQVPGRVAKIWVEAGSRVKPGDPLVTLSAAEFQARLNQAQAQLTQAAADYKRYQFLFKEGAASPQEFGAIEARYKTAQAQVSEAATMKGYTVVKAPEAGVVAERKVAVGDLAQPGQMLVALYNPDLLQIEGEVNDSYREQVKVGETAQVSVPAVKFEASLPLAEIFPISAAGSRTFKVRTARLTNPLLVPGMFARLTLPLGSGRGILIPKEAVSTVGQLTMVRVVVKEASELRQVKLGRQVGEQVEVLAGLQAGDRIILAKE
ncbi:MAG: efflux RND transporter periplasmic adaptor subunit [Syntrophobacterales bacterium]|jgi:RND family efflux transporter MFP subunit|nr:efflux RND transporter periplasmic adaptor subunit [Syntrophobacterales bacterium]